jgi:hypothetical protein
MEFSKDFLRIAIVVIPKKINMPANLDRIVHSVIKPRIGKTSYSITRRAIIHLLVIISMEHVFPVMVIVSSRELLKIVIVAISLSGSILAQNA